MTSSKAQLARHWATIKTLALNEAKDDLDERLEAARKLCSAVLRNNPINADFLSMRGFIAYRQNRMDEAETFARKAASLEPRSSDNNFTCGIILMARKKNLEALPFFQRVVELNPGHAPAHYLVACALKTAGEFEKALVAFDRALALDPTNFKALNDKGNALKELNRLSEAVQCYEQALTINPDFPSALNNLGVIHFLINDLDGAEALHKKALALHADYPEAYNNLAIIQRLKGDLASAEAFCQKALALNPDYPEALSNLGNTLKDLKRFDESIQAYRKALALMPYNAEIHHNLAMALLAVGHFDEGWREYAWRWKTKQLHRGFRGLSQPEWQGESGQGQTLLVHAEQGFGDTLQFCRYAPLAKKRGFRVIMEVPPQLARLLQSLKNVDQIVVRGDELPHFDLHCPIMNLPLAFRTTVQTIPGNVPYLSPDMADAAQWRKRVQAAAGNAFKVGLVWAGSSRKQSTDLIATDKKRSVAPEIIAPLLDVKGARFFSLQKDGPQAPGSFGLIDLVKDCRDFADTAALIANLDLVITVDTAVAHLAGAIGKPTWLLNRFNSCWRWFAEREDSPWYPENFRIFRQQTMGAWVPVVTRVREALTTTVIQALRTS